MVNQGELGAGSRSGKFRRVNKPGLRYDCDDDNDDDDSDDGYDDDDDDDFLSPVRHRW